MSALLNQMHKMMIWQTFLFQNPDEKAYATTILSALKEQGFKSYDPFPGGLGAPIGKVERLRMFLAPSHSGWQRLCVAPQDTVPTEIIDSLAAIVPNPVLWLRVHDAEQMDIHLLPEKTSEWQALAPFLQTASDVDGLTAAATQSLEPTDEPAMPIPSDIQQLAKDRGVSDKQIDKMMGRMSKSLFKKASQDDAEANLADAQAALNSGPKGMQWGSVAGQRLRAVMQHLVIPEDYWRLPDWQSLTGAYQIARQAQRGHAELLTGDRERLEAVPDALDYQLLYVSRKPV